MDGEMARFGARRFGPAVPVASPMDRWEDIIYQ